MLSAVGAVDAIIKYVEKLIATAALVHTGVWVRRHFIGAAASHSLTFRALQFSDAHRPYSMPVVPTSKAKRFTCNVWLSISAGVS